MALLSGEFWNFCTHYSAPHLIVHVLILAAIYPRKHIPFMTEAPLSVSL